jgi:hypothetical protein
MHSTTSKRYRKTVYQRLRQQFFSSSGLYFAGAVITAFMALYYINPRTTVFPMKGRYGYFPYTSPLYYPERIPYIIGLGFATVMLVYGGSQELRKSQKNPEKRHQLRKGK